MMVIIILSPCYRVSFGNVMQLKAALDGAKALRAEVDTKVNTIASFFSLCFTALLLGAFHCSAFSYCLFLE